MIALPQKPIQRYLILSLPIVVLMLVAVTYAWSQANRFDGATLDPVMAYEKAKSGEITLVDIRRPDEWARTGSGQGAHRLDMRDRDFIARLNKLVNGNKNAKIALMCARGVRSARLSNRLTEAGFTNIIDVPEGMLGSRVGPGWLKRKLPLNRDG
ncbi:MAG: rhodanese-like domain-containing protein [Pseudomonadota bacterium]